MNSKRRGIESEVKEIRKINKGEKYSFNSF